MGNLTTGIHRFHALDTELTYMMRGSGPYLVYFQIGLSPLEDQFTIIYPEPRGSGSSARPQQVEMISTSDMADDVEHLRRHLQLEQIDILGHSHGGTIALALLNDTRILHVWQQLVDNRKNNAAFAKSLEALERAKTQKFQSQDEWFQSFRIFATFEKAMGVPSWWVYEAQLAADKTKPPDLYGALHTVKARTQRLGCSEDPMCSENVSRITAERIPGSQLVVIPHYDFFAAVTQFLG
ncbi:alpha/beta-hydrolase [Trichoderma novae-zelandiae]